MQKCGCFCAAAPVDKHVDKHGFAKPRFGKGGPTSTADDEAFPDSLVGSWLGTVANQMTPRERAEGCKALTAAGAGRGGRGPPAAAGTGGRIESPGENDAETIHSQMPMEASVHDGAPIMRE